MTLLKRTATVMARFPPWSKPASRSPLTSTMKATARASLTTSTTNLAFSSSMMKWNINAKYANNSTVVITNKTNICSNSCIKHRSFQSKANREDWRTQRQASAVRPTSSTSVSEGSAGSFSLSSTPRPSLPFITRISTFSTKQPADDDGSGDSNNNNANKENERVHENLQNDDFPSPLDSNKTLGNYIQDHWWKDGITEQEKESVNSQGIRALRFNPVFRQGAQMSLKIDLEHFLNSGEAILLDEENDGSSGPPDDNKTLGNYIQDHWWKDGITEEKKESVNSQGIRALRIDQGLIEFVQMSLKIDLELFLNSGEAILLMGNTARGAPERVAVVDYDIQGTEMLYKRDVIAFKGRIEELFEWKNSEKDKFMAPYFPLIQSSGTGKTKLMHEYKKILQGNYNDKIHCELVLCHDGEKAPIIGSDAPENSVFSQTLDATQYSTTNEGRKQFWDMLDKLVNNRAEKKMVVLLFDESQHLVKKADGWHFRSIRWWLRSQRSDCNVVCVFAGTNTSLANYFTEPKESTTSRGAVIEYNKGDILYPPFFEITTTGLVSVTDRSSIENDVEREIKKGTTEFDVAVPYGRPLFARMHLKGELNDALGSILLRMRGSAKDEDTVDSLQQDFSILATRLQMGQVPLDFASKQVASAYAHLTHFDPEHSTVAEIAYLPDPVCAWLAMTQMIKECSLFDGIRELDLKSSEHPSAWSEKAIKIYSSGLCRPAKGDVGEVAAAFYMLACGDELRFEQSKELTKLSVPLESWVKRLQGNHESDTDFQADGPTINFIQVCRSYLRPSLKEMESSGLLEHWYHSARASYMYASCQAYDLLVPVKYKTDEGYAYCPMLVSVKNQLSFTDPQDALNSMEKALEDANIKIGMCMLLLIGLEGQSLSPQQTTEFKLCTDGKEISSVIIEVPEWDPYGATDLALCPTCGGGERSEVMASHADLALGAGKSFNRLLRSKTKKADLSTELLEDIRNQYSEVLQRDKSD